MMGNSATQLPGAIELPGFGLPRFEERPEDKLFLHVLRRNEVHLHCVTLRERRMLAFIGAITDKPDWHRKVFDDGIVSKWREEAMALPRVENNDVYMSDAMFDLCVAELRDKATRFAKTGFIDILDAETTTVKSDTAISEGLAADLCKCVAVLENVPDRQKDWHPGTDKQVLDLLHPSLFPVVFGKTKALRTGVVPLDRCMDYTGKGELTTEGAWEDESGVDPYQWLPSDVTLTDSGASITSYINNLHPLHHKALYGVLEKFVSAAVPLWEECLSWSNTDRRRLVLDGTDDEDDYVIPDGVKYSVPRANGNGFHGDGEGDADSTGEPEDDEYLYTEEYEDWKKQHRILQFPEPGPFVPFDQKVNMEDRVNLKAQFPQGLQVIFKLANIHLTPDKPEYAGGSWHVEGTLAELISATAIYYCDEENITSSELAFRHSLHEFDMIMIPAQDAHDSLLAYLGFDEEPKPIQDLGAVVTRQGRLLAFPNILQHRVGSFRLKDPEKPGHRKILATFLVDPHRRILSTANVPPQQKDWWADVAVRETQLSSIPPELMPSIFDSVDSAMGWDEAVEIREDLMAKRSQMTQDHEEEIQEGSFSFCEH